jgi:hypothetical protein
MEQSHGYKTLPVKTMLGEIIGFGMNQTTLGVIGSDHAH